MDILLALGLGLGLSAASGFRVFVPLLGLSLAGLAGWVILPPGAEWLGTWPACLALGTATLLEIGGYYIPWLDHLLDSLATPLAALAGCLLTLVALHDLPPALRWFLAVIAGLFLTNYASTALGARDPVQIFKWIKEHAAPLGQETGDTLWRTGVYHDASNSRPSFSQFMTTKVREIQGRYQDEGTH